MIMATNTAQNLTFQAESGERGASSDIISLPEACKFLGVHRNTLYKLIEAGEIPAFRLIKGGRWKFRKKELEQWLEDKQSRARL
jgi:excisionase family DNA binding protein